MCIQDLGIYSSNVKRDICSFINCNTNGELHLHLLHCHFPHYVKNETRGTLLRFVFQGVEGGGKKSVLDMDPEVQAIMEMTGKTLHSQGLREPEEDQDQ